MKIGIVSDSHGKTRRLERAVRMLVERGAAAIVHCGDLEGSESLTVLGDAGAAAYAVAGNMDRHSPHLADAAAGAGVTFGWRTVEVELGDGRLLTATHGDDDRLLAELLAGEQFAFVCCGHTHQRRLTRLGAVTVINPGAIHRANPHSAAMLDTDTGDVTFMDGF